MSIATGSHYSLSRHNRPEREDSIPIFDRPNNIEVWLNPSQPGGSVPQSLIELYKEVAPNAILNAGGRADEVRCYPGTREEVIGRTERWMYEQGSVDSKMMWLTGPAGSGKSAIVQTIAERCQERGVQAASFFFFRADPTRNTARPLVATLLYQIFKFHPPARRAAATTLSEEPLLLRSSIQDQFNKLLFASLQDFPLSLGSSSRRPIVLLIDGLDECDSDQLSQTQIIQALDRLVTPNNSPFLVLIASRAESHMVMAFNRLASRVDSIFLDDKYRPEDDIRRFVTAKFEEIKLTHPFAHSLDERWPSFEDVEYIVKNSSGQFVFAATVMRYLMTSSTSPALLLERVNGTTPVRGFSPFAHLDAIYITVLSQVRDSDAMRDILSMRLLFDALSVRDTIGLSRIPLKYALCVYKSAYTPLILDATISDLGAIMTFNQDNLVFYHASLPDFLRDKSRAGVYYIDIDAFGEEILPKIWSNATESWEMARLGLYLFNALKKPTPDITRTILSTPPVSMEKFFYIFQDTPGLGVLLQNIYRLYYPHDIESYRQMIRKWVSGYINHSPEPNLKTLQSQSLPYVTTSIWVTQTKRLITRILNALFHIKP